MSARIKNYGKGESALAACGIAVLSAAYVFWLLNSQHGIWGRLAALLSLALFIRVCLGFVPVWFSAWRQRGMAAEARSDASSAGTVFISLLGFCIAATLLVWLLRLLQGRDESYWQSLQYWTYTDSHHYLDIARDWYLSEGDWDRLVQLVFLPGYPLLIRLFSLAVRDYTAAAFIVSALSFAGAGALLYELFRLDYGHSTALRAVVFLCLVPGSFFFAAPMSEGLFLLCCAACLYLVRRGRTGLGCLIGGYAAFTRSLGLMLFAPVFFELVQEKRGWRRFLWLILIPAGFAAYCFINWQVSGDPFKYMEYQKVHWGQSLGFFFNTAAYQLENAVAYLAEGNSTAWGLWVPNLVCSFLALIVMVPAAKRLRPSYTAWFIAYYAVAIGATWLLSAPRYLAAMPVIALALALDTERRPLPAAALLGGASLLYLTAFTLGLQVW